MFRHGQWVKTSTEIPGAHKSPDGKSIGIYQRARAVDHAAASDEDGTIIAKAFTELVPEHVAFVKENGKNLNRLADDGDGVTKVCVPPELLSDLEAVLDHDHLPESRKNPDFPVGAQLKP
jgi:hypothetical protein